MPVPHDQVHSAERVLITGASGGIGQLMRTRLARPGRVLRLFDIAAPAPAAPGEAVEVVTGSITDTDAITAACQDVDAVIHLGGHSRETSWENILDTNINGTHSVLEAMRTTGVRRGILASSNHAAGYWTRAEAGGDGLSADVAFRPDTYYGVGKVALEALGNLYHHRFGMDIICLRIGSCFPTPGTVRGLTTWLSPADGARLFEACLSVPSPGFRTVWAVSANTRSMFSLAEARALGYEPRDNAETFAADLIAEQGADTTPPSRDYVGGPFLLGDLGVPN